MVSQVGRVLKMIVECLEKEIKKYGSLDKKLTSMELCLRYVEETIENFKKEKNYKHEI